MISEGFFDSIALSAIMGEVFSRSDENFLLLSVTDGTSEKYFVFKSDSVTLLSLGPRKQALLGDVLVKTRRISEQQLKEALEEQHRTKDYLGNILINKGYASKDTIRNAVREQIYEELFDLITWEEAKYRFEVKDPSKDKIPTFDDPALRATNCEMNTHLLAVEVGKHIEHWEMIKDELPSEMEVPALTGDEAPEEMEDVDEFCKRVLLAADGRTPIGPLAARSGMSLFRAYLSIDKLIKKGKLRFLSSEEIRALVDSLPPEHPALTEWNLEECADAVEHREIISNTVRSLHNVFVMEELDDEKRLQLEQEDPGGVITHLLDGTNTVREVVARTKKTDVEVCGVIGRLLRNGFVRPATPSELREKATELQIQGDLDRAEELLKWANRLAEDDPSLKQEIAIVAAAKGNRRLAAAYYRELAETARREGDFDQAVIALSRVAELAPESFEVNKELAGVYLQKGEEYREQALAEFGQALAKLAICGLYERAREVADELLQLIPDHEEIKAQLVDLITKIESSGKPPEGVCPQCKATVPDDARECPECGAPLFHQCMTCGEELKIGTFICPKCGKDPYALPRKGQKGYTVRMKRIEEKSGFVRFKLFDSLAKARKAVAEKQFTKAIESIQEAQALQPYNEVLKTELEEIKKLAEEHERHKQEIEEEIDLQVSPKRMVKRFLVLLAVTLVVMGAAAAGLFFFLKAGEDEKAFESLSARMVKFEKSTDPADIAHAMKEYRAFLKEFPESDLAPQVNSRLKSLRRRYEAAAAPLWKKVEPAVRRYAGKTAKAILKSIKKGELEQIRSYRKFLSEFLDTFPESANAPKAAQCKKVLSKVLSAAAAAGGTDLAERNAADALEKAKAKAEREGFAAARPDFERVAREFKGTFAAARAEQELKKYDAFLARLDDTLSRARALLKEGRYSDALDVLKSLPVDYPSAPHMKEIRTLEERIKTARKTFEREVNSLASRWEKGKMAPDEYRGALDRLFEKYSGSGWEERIREMRIELENFVKEARLLKERAAMALAKGDYQQAFLFHKRLIENYRRAMDLSDIIIHIWLKSEPAGADVFTPQGGEMKKVGTTPCIVTVPYLNGKGKSVYILRKRGFVDGKVIIESSEVLGNDYFNYPLIRLVSTYSFRWEVEGGISATPVRLESGRKGKLLFPHGFGLVFLDLANGGTKELTIVTPRKERPIEDDPTRKTLAAAGYWKLRNPLTPVRLKGDRFDGSFLALPASDGRVYLVDPARERVAGSFGLKYAYNLHPSVVFHRIPLLLNRTFAYFSAIDGRIYCCDPQTDAIRWTLSTKSKGKITLYGGERYLLARLSNGRTLVLDYAGEAAGGGKVLGEFFSDSLLLHGGYLYSLAGGNVEVRSASTPAAAPLERYAGKFSIDARLYLLGDLVLACEPRVGTLAAFSNGKFLWRAAFGASIDTVPSRMGNRVVVALTDGRVLLLDAASGRTLKENRYKHQWMGKITVVGERLYLYDVDGTVTVIEPLANRLVWTNSDIRGERIVDLIPLADDLVVVSERAVYYFERILNGE